MKCTQRLYLTKDRKKVVAEGDKAAATLYAVPGDEIPQSAVEMFGLVDGGLKPARTKEASSSAPASSGKGGRASSAKVGKGGSTKEQAPAPNKEQAPSQDKDPTPVGDGQQGSGEAQTETSGESA